MYLLHPRHFSQKNNISVYIPLRESGVGVNINISVAMPIRHTRKFVCCMLCWAQVAIGGHIRRVAYSVESNCRREELWERKFLLNTRRCVGGYSVNGHPYPIQQFSALRMYHIIWRLYEPNKSWIVMLCIWELCTEPNVYAYRRSGVVKRERRAGSARRTQPTAPKNTSRTTHWVRVGAWMRLDVAAGSEFVLNR